MTDLFFDESIGGDFAQTDPSRVPTTSEMVPLRSVVKSELLRLSPGSGRYSFPLSERTREMGVIREPNLGSDLCNRQMPRSQVILGTAQTLVQKILVW